MSDESPASADIPVLTDVVEDNFDPEATATPVPALSGPGGVRMIPTPGRRISHTVRYR